MTSDLKLWEVGPRDGLQSEKKILTPQEKMQLISALYKAGSRNMEVGSFVSPKSIPTLTESEVVLQHALTLQNLNANSLIMNAKGLDRALAAGAKSVCLVAIVSDSLSQKNAHRPSQQLFDESLELLERARNNNLFVRVDIATSWVCPFEGPINFNRVIPFVEAFVKGGADEIALADTIGHAYPAQVKNSFETLSKIFGSLQKIGAHFHDTQGFGIANTAAALEAGVRIFDSSIGGIGGCPYAPGAAGNLATEDIVLLAQKMGLNTGLDLNEIWNAVELTGQLIGRKVGGRSAGWWYGRNKAQEQGGL